MDSHSVRTKKEVEDFLCHFLPKMDVLGIIFLNRSKNQEAWQQLSVVEVHASAAIPGCRQSELYGR